MILGIIGPEGVGKTTTAVALARDLRRRGHATAHIDGDLARTIIGNGDYTSRGRIANAWATGGMVRGLSRGGYNVLISAVFPTNVVRRSFQHACGERIFWVHLEYEPFIHRAHGLTLVEGLRNGEDGYRFTGRFDNVAYAVQAIETHVSASGYHWLSVLDVPDIAKEERVQTGDGGGI